MVTLTLYFVFNYIREYKLMTLNETFNLVILAPNKTTDNYIRLYKIKQ